MEQLGNEGYEAETFKCKIKYSKLVLNFVFNLTSTNNCVRIRILVRREHNCGKRILRTIKNKIKHFK